MELKRGLELVEVNFDDKKATLVFLDDIMGVIHEVNWNKQVYNADTKKWEDSEEKAAKVEEWSEEIFGLSFDQLGQAVGEQKDVYCYPTFNSLWEVKQLAKFTEEYVGQILQVEVTNVYDNEKAVMIEFEFDGDTYGSKMQYAQYIEVRQQWLVNPIKQQKVYEKFEKKFGFPVEQMTELIGKTVMVEVKKAFGQFIYTEIKPLVLPKKK